MKPVEFPLNNKMAAHGHLLIVLVPPFTQPQFHNYVSALCEGRVV